MTNLASSLALRILTHWTWIKSDPFRAHVYVCEGWCVYAYISTCICDYWNTSFKKNKKHNGIHAPETFFINSGINESEKETNILLCIKQMYQKKEVQGEKEYRFYR